MMGEIDLNLSNFFKDPKFLQHPDDIKALVEGMI